MFVSNSYSATPIFVIETVNVFIILFLNSVRNAFILWLILKVFLEFDMTVNVCDN